MPRLETVLLAAMRVAFEKKVLELNVSEEEVVDVLEVWTSAGMSVGDFLTLILETPEELENA